MIAWKVRKHKVKSKVKRRRGDDEEEEKEEEETKGEDRQEQKSKRASRFHAQLPALKPLPRRLFTTNSTKKRVQAAFCLSF